MNPQCKNGGTWSGSSGMHVFESSAEAFVSGCLTNQLYGYWGCVEGAAGSWNEAILNYGVINESASNGNQPSPEVTELTSRLNSLKQYFAIVAGETGTGEGEAAGIGSVIVNILRLKCFSVFDANFTSEIGGTVYFNTIGSFIYNDIMSDSWDNIFSSENQYSSRITGASIALVSGIDYSYGAYFFNATSQYYTQCIGGNWTAYDNGAFIITQSIGGTTFFKYKDKNKHWK